jgi:hypothetical protein
MINSLKRTAVASLTVLTLSASAVALATPVSAAGSTWRDHYGRHWHRGGWGCAGAGCYRYGYGPFYRGYGHNSNNWC